jgi:hypothetical protein
VRFYLNYGPEPVTHAGRTIAPAGVVALRNGDDLLAEP